MKRNGFNLVAVVALLLSTASIGYIALAQSGKPAAAPTVVSYQGYVTVNGAPYTGTGYFKFAIVDGAGTTSYWSNNGTSSGGGAPNVAVQLTVSGGMFNVLLGDTSQAGMTQPVTTDAFGGSDRRLRTWFATSSGGPWTQLTPDRVIASVPFALVAESAASAAYAENAGLLGGDPASLFQHRVSGSCARGSTVWAVNEDGTVACLPVQPRPAFLLTSLDIPGLSYDPSLAMGTDGLGLIAYFEFGYENLWVAHCDDPACTMATAFQLDNEGYVGSDPSLIIGGDGLGLISYSYYDGANSALKAAHCQDTACSTATYASLDSSANVGWMSSITIGGDGLGLISYRDTTNSDLKVAHCNDVACASAAVQTPDSAGNVGEYSSITTGADGLGLISYYDSAPNYDLKVAHCDNATCSVATTTTIDNTGGTVGMYTSITIGSDGRGLISYVGDGDLRVFHCGNLACSSGTSTTLDSAGILEYTSITLGLDGLALISYYDLTNRDLKLAHCNDTACTAAAITTLDSAGDVGLTPSITIGADGLGLIAYRDVTNFKLKVAHLSNALGTPWVRRR